MSEEKFSKCEEGKKKNVSVEFRVFEKKRKLKERFRKKIKVFFLVKIFVKFVFTV